MKARQRQIIEAAIPFVLDEGIKASTARIAKAAGVSNGTLFNAFPTKQALIDAIYVTAKTGMFDALPAPDDSAFDRNGLRRSWRGYLAWARENPSQRRIMHRLLEAGLVGAEAQAEIDALGAPHAARIAEALARGEIRAPSVDFAVRLVFFHVDLVIDQALGDADEALAFDMLCNSLGIAE